jgi:hypothetical protein
MKLGIMCRKGMTGNWHVPRLPFFFFFCLLFWFFCVLTFFIFPIITSRFLVLLVLGTRIEMIEVSRESEVKQADGRT